MRLKPTYSSREVAALTGLTARQLQLWDAGGLVAAAIPSHRTEAAATPSAGTRRSSSSSCSCSPIFGDADSPSTSSTRSSRILREQFGARLFEATGGGGEVQLLTDGAGHLRAHRRAASSSTCCKTPTQPLLVIGNEGSAEGAERGTLRAKRSRSELGALADREDLFEVVGRTRNDVHADELADAARGGGAGVGRGLHRADVAAHDRGHEAGVDFLPADEHDVRGLDHRVGGFDHADEPARLDHAERVADVAFVFVSHVDVTLSQLDRRVLWILRAAMSATQFATRTAPGTSRG